MKYLLLILLTTHAFAYDCVELGGGINPKRLSFHSVETDGQLYSAKILFKGDSMIWVGKETNVSIDFTEYTMFNQDGEKYEFKLQEFYGGHCRARICNEPLYTKTMKISNEDGLNEYYSCL